MRGLAQGADEIRQTIPYVLVLKLLRSGAYHLEDDGHSALFLIGIGNGQGDPLPLRFGAQDDELAGLSLAGYQGRFDVHAYDRRIQNGF